MFPLKAETLKLKDEPTLTVVKHTSMAPIVGRALARAGPTLG